MAQAPLGPGHRLHRQHRDARRPHAQQREQEITFGGDGETARDGEQVFHVRHGALGERGADRGHHHRRQRAGGVAAQDQFIAVKGAGQRRVEGGGDGGARARGDEDAQIGAAQAEPAPHPGIKAGAELAVARLHAQGSARAIGQHGGEGQPQGIAQAHAPAMQGIGFDGIGDIGEAPLAWPAPPPPAASPPSSGTTSSRPVLMPMPSLK